MKFRKTIGAAAIIAVAGLAGLEGFARETTVEKKGTIEQMLMNPEGDADGFVLQDGTQVHFPPHMSAELRGAVAVKDAVEMKGVAENAKRFRAESVTNTKTGKTIKDVPPHLMGAKRPHPEGPRGPKAKERLDQLSAEGQISRQLFGPRGEVNGVILADGTVVRVGPRARDTSEASLDVGKKLRASGYGTKNESGTSLEATDLKNL